MGGLGAEGLTHWKKGLICLTHHVWHALPPEQQKEELNVLVPFCERVAVLVESAEVPAVGAQMRKVAFLPGCRLVYVPRILDVKQMTSVWVFPLTH